MIAPDHFRLAKEHYTTTSRALQLPDTYSLYALCRTQQSLGPTGNLIIDGGWCAAVGTISTTAGEGVS